MIENQLFLFLIVRIDIFGIDNVVCLLATSTTAGSLSRTACLAASLRPGLVHGFGNLMRCLRKRVRGLVDSVDISLIQRLLAIGDGSLDGFRIGVGKFIAILSQQLLGLVDQRVGAVAGFDLFTSSTVLVSMRVCIGNHPTNLLLGQTAGRG